MKKTVLTQLIEHMQELEATDNPIYNRAKELLEEERKQIEDAYDNGSYDGQEDTYVPPSVYYNKIYGGKDE